MKRELDVVREQLTAVIASLKEEDFERVLPHPLFQELTVRQWIEFIGHHDKRHLSQIKEIKEKNRKSLIYSDSFCFLFDVPLV